MQSMKSASLDKYITYRKNPKLLVVSLCLSVLTFVVYLFYFDILSPSIPDGSVRFNTGVFFAIPVFLLTSSQTLFGTYLLHVTIKSTDQSKRDVLKAYFVASFQILLFSLNYVIVPYYGPYALLIALMPEQHFSAFSYIAIFFWTLAIIFITSQVISHLFHLQSSKEIGPWRILILAASMLMLVTAIATG